MQVYLETSTLSDLYEGKEKQVLGCSSKEFVLVVNILECLECISDCSTLSYLHYSPPSNGEQIHSIRVLEGMRLLFKQSGKDEITIVELH